MTSKAFISSAAGIIPAKRAEQPITIITTRTSIFNFIVHLLKKFKTRQQGIAKFLHSQSPRPAIIDDCKIKIGLPGSAARSISQVAFVNKKPAFGLR